MWCKTEQMRTADFSEKSLPKVCPQTEESLFAAIYILRPINVLWPPSTSTHRHSQPEGGNAKLICVLKLLSQADVSKLQWLCIGDSAGLHGILFAKNLSVKCEFLAFVVFSTLYLRYQGWDIMEKLLPFYNDVFQFQIRLKATPLPSSELDVTSWWHLKKIL